MFDSKKAYFTDSTRYDTNVDISSTILCKPNSFKKQVTSTTVACANDYDDENEKATVLYTPSQLAGCMSSISSYGDPVMAVPVSLQLQYIQTSGDISPEYKTKASYFIAAFIENHNDVPCNLNSPLTPKLDYSNGPYTINVIDSGSD